MRETVVSFRLDASEIKKLERYSKENKEIGLKSHNQYARKALLTFLDNLYCDVPALRQARSVFTSPMRLQAVEALLFRMGALHLELGAHTAIDRRGKVKQFSKFTFMIVDSFAVEGIDVKKLSARDIYRRASQFEKTLK